MRIADWFAGQSFCRAQAGDAGSLRSAIVEHWRARIASGELSAAQVTAAERIIGRNQPEES